MIRYCSGFSTSVLPEHELVQEALFLLGAIGVGIGVADEIGALRSIAVDDGEADAIEREADAAPCPVEAVVDDELARAVRAAFSRRARSGPPGSSPPGPPRSPAVPACRNASISRVSISASSPGSGGVTAHTKAAGATLSIYRRRHLLAAPVRHVDLDGARLRSRARCACGTCRACRCCRRAVEDLAERLGRRVVRHVRAVLRPIGFHDAERRLFDREHEAGLGPELARRVPRRLRESCLTTSQRSVPPRTIRASAVGVRRDRLGAARPGRPLRGETRCRRHA